MVPRQQVAICGDPGRRGPVHLAARPCETPAVGEPPRRQAAASITRPTWSSRTLSRRCGRGRSPEGCRGKKHLTRRRRASGTEMSRPRLMVPSMDFLSVCAESLTVSDDHVRTLEARLDPAHEIEPVVWCELQQGHPGPHLALGQAYEDAIELWLRWQSGLSAEIFEVGEPGYCTAEGPDPEESGEVVECQMPTGHPGAHSFQLQPGQVGGRAPRKASAGWTKPSARP